MSASSARLVRPGRRSAILILSGFILFIDGYDLFALGTVGPSLLRHDEWHVTAGTLGTLGSATALGMPVGSMLAGWLGDRYGRRRPLTLFLSLISAAMLLAALAPNLGTFAVARVLTGLGIGALAPLVGALVTDHAPTARRTLSIAAVMACVGIGGTVSALLGRLLLPQTPFQWIFAMGGLPLLLLPFVWRLLPASDGPGIATGEPRAAAHAEPARPIELLAPGRRWTTLVLLLAAFMSFVLIYSTSTWLPTVMIRSGYDLASAMEFSIAFTLGAAVGSVLLSLLGDMGHLRAVTVGGFLIGAAGLLALSTHQPRPLLLLLSALAGVGSMGTQSLVVACMASHYPPALRATGMGFTLGIGRVGAIAGPTYLSAATALITSPRAGFYAFSLPAVLGAIAVLLLPRNHGRDSARTVALSGPEPLREAT
ncbi:MFS transporter [Streptomyces sp. NBC_00063]|uniref:MFS transporter n=1 Tax=Streptomyces sp. NBC_00063 TaxID=2975638 RepID=UPI003D70BF53